MIVRCACGKNLRVADQLVGRNIKCPGCGEVFVARATSSAVTPSAAAPAPALSKASLTAPVRADKEVASKPRQPARSSSILLVISAMLAVLALSGFIASGVLVVLAVNASPVNGPAAPRKGKPKTTQARPPTPAPAAPPAP